MEARGGNGIVSAIPAEATQQEAYVQQRGVGNPPEMHTQVFLSCIRQERLLERLCVAMETIASELSGPAKPKRKG